MKIVIYHADCLDGLGAAWVAFRKFAKQARYIPARYGDPLPNIQAGDSVYILDYSFPPEVLFEAASRAESITLLDHHQTAIKAYDGYLKKNSLPDNFKLIFSNELSGCVLAWHFFEAEQEVPPLLKHIQDRDLWLFELPGTREITTALYNRMPFQFESLNGLDLNELLSEGKQQVKLFDKEVSRLFKHRHKTKLSSFSGLAVNAPAMYSSELGNLLAKSSGTFGMTYQFNGERSQWVCSLRSMGDFDVGALAEQFGGGGHKNASGFKMNSAQFFKLLNF